MFVMFRRTPSLCRNKNIHAFGMMFFLKSNRVHKKKHNIKDMSWDEAKNEKAIIVHCAMSCNYCHSGMTSTGQVHRLEDVCLNSWFQVSLCGPLLWQYSYPLLQGAGTVYSFGCTNKKIQRNKINFKIPVSTIDFFYF